MSKLTKEQLEHQRKVAATIKWDREQVLRACENLRDSLAEQGRDSIGVSVLEQLALQALTPATDAVRADAELRDATFWNGVAYGEVYGDQKGRFQDGERVSTSLVKAVYVVTRNTVYKATPRENDPYEASIASPQPSTPSADKNT